MASSNFGKKDVAKTESEIGHVNRRGQQEESAQDCQSPATSPATASNGEDNGNERRHINISPSSSKLEEEARLIEYRPQTKEEFELELEKLFFAGKAKCINGHIYERICMMGPCPICNGLQYQFSLDDPLFDFDYDPEPLDDDEEEMYKHLDEPHPMSSITASPHEPGYDEDEVYEQIDRDRRLAIALEAEERVEFGQHLFVDDEELPIHLNGFKKTAWPWIQERNEAEQAPPAPPEKILVLYVNFRKTFDMCREEEPRSHLENRFYRGYLLPPFPSLTMDEKLAVCDAKTAMLKGAEAVREIQKNKEFKIVAETSRRYHRLNPIPVTLKTNIESDEFRLARDQIWAQIKANVEMEMGRKERRGLESINIKKLCGQADDDDDKDKKSAFSRKSV